MVLLSDSAQRQRRQRLSVDGKHCGRSRFIKLTRILFVFLKVKVHLCSVDFKKDALRDERVARLDTVTHEIKGIMLS